MDWQDDRASGLLVPNPEVLFHSTAPVSSGTAGGTLLITSFTFPGGKLGPQDTIKISGTMMSPAALTTGNLVLFLETGATDFWYNNCSTERSVDFVALIHADNSLTAQKATTRFKTNGYSYGEEPLAPEAFTVDTTSDFLIGLNAEAMTAAEEMVIERLTIEHIRAVG